MEASKATRAKGKSAKARQEAKSKATKRHQRAGALDQAPLPGQVVAVTATGPVMRTNVGVVRLPVASALAFLHELAVKVGDRNARVVSSMAARLDGDDALCAWARTSTLISRQIGDSPPELQMAFLRELMKFTKRIRNLEGIESVHAAALNAVWPWLDQRALERMLTGFSKRHAKSRFAAEHWIPVFDPTSRTVTVFAPGDLAKLDPNDWLNERAVTPPGIPGMGHGTPGAGGGFGAPGAQGEFGAPGGYGPTAPGGFGVPGGARGGYGRKGGLPGGLGWDGRGMPGGISGLGVPGGHSGPDLSGYGGPDLSGNGEPQLPKGMSGLGVPGGDRRGPDMTDAGGPDLSGGGEPQIPEGLSGLGVPDGPLSGPGGIESLGQTGGPFGHGSYLGAEGASDWLSAEKAEGKAWQAVGIAAMTAGFGGMITGVAIGQAGVVLVGALVMNAGAYVWGEGKDQERQAELATPSTTGGPATQPQSGSGTSTPEKSPTPEGAITITPAKHPPPPEEPKKKDIYPDPYGTGGGNPTQLWDEDGGGGRPDTIWDDENGGGRPNTLPREDGGGGRPNTIWDEEGGGRPDTVWAFHGGGQVAATAGIVEETTTLLAGPGLMAGFVQVGPSTFAI